MTKAKTFSVMISLSLSFSLTAISNAATLGYSTFLGTSDSDQGYDIDVTDSGEAIIVGRTNASINFPTTAGSYDETFNGGTHDVFVTKFSTDGSTLNYSTLLGGNSYDYGFGIKVDINGSAYLTGQTKSNDFPTINAYDSTNPTNSDQCFVTKISSQGNSLVFSTYLGGTPGNDVGYAITLDLNLNVFVTGYTASNNFPTQNAYNSVHNGNWDAFVTKFSSDGSNLVYSTFLGGNSTDDARAIDVDGSGNAYITGRTFSDNFPTQNAYDSSHNSGTYDVFVTKFSSDGLNLNYSTFLGGNSYDNGNGIAVDGTGNAFITGHTESSNFPTQNAFESTYNGGSSDAFVSKLTSDGSNLSFSTFLGGSSDDNGKGITIDANGNTFVTGYTGSNDFPTQNPTYPSQSGGNDLFITQFNSSGSSLEYSTFFGGGNTDSQSSVGNPAVYKNGSLFLTGYVGSGFPTTNGAYSQTYSGGAFDAAVVKLDFPNNNYALSFDGLNDRIEKQNFNNFPSTEITAEFWMKSSDTVNQGTAISYAIPAQFNEFAVFRYQDYKINIDGFSQSSTGITLTDGTWHHFSLTWKSSTGESKIYVDGNLGSSFNFANGGSMTSNGIFIMGQEQDSYGGAFEADQAFEGLIDEVRIWNKALTTAEVQAKWNKVLDPTQETGLVAYWNFDEGIGTTTTDLTGTGNGMTLINGTAWSTDVPTLFDGDVDLIPTSLVSTSTNSAQSFTPQVTIENLGSGSAPSTTATMEISFDGSQIYTDTQIIPSISAVSSTTVSFTSILPYESGTYDVVVYTELSGDSDTSNDTLWTSFEVIGDVRVNEFLPFGLSSLGYQILQSSLKLPTQQANPLTFQVGQLKTLQMI